MLLASDLSPWVVRGIALLFGSVWGSFFNVVIYRLPREMSVVSPPSHCPACKAPIQAWRNVPIIGYLMLRGRAACCGARLSPRYAVVEGLTGLMCVALAERIVIGATAGTPLVDAGLTTLVYFAFVGGLIVVTFINLEWMEIPDEISLPGAALGLLTAGMRAHPGAEAAAIGAGAGYLIVQVLFVWSYERLTGRRGMGEGDSKLLLMVGAFVGWRGMLFALVGGAFQGILVTVTMMALGQSVTPAARREHEDSAEDTDDDGRSAPDEETDAAGDPPPEHLGHTKVPYGPFLALAAVEYLFFGDTLVRAYLTLFE